MILFPDADPHMAEGAAVMLFYQVGELFQSYAVGKSRKSIAAMMDIAPDYANVEDENGRTHPGQTPTTSPWATVIVVKARRARAASMAPCCRGASRSLTPRRSPASPCRATSRSRADEIVSGCINMTGLIKVRTTKPFGESTVSRILELVENAGREEGQDRELHHALRPRTTPRPSPASAVALALVGGRCRRRAGRTGCIARPHRSSSSRARAPSSSRVPLSFFGGIGGASRIGVLVKGSNYLEALAERGHRRVRQDRHAHRTARSTSWPSIPRRASIPTTCSVCCRATPRPSRTTPSRCRSRPPYTGRHRPGCASMSVAGGERPRRLGPRARADPRERARGPRGQRQAHEPPTASTGTTASSLARSCTSRSTTATSATSSSPTS